MYPDLPITLHNASMRAMWMLRRKKSIEIAPGAMQPVTRLVVDSRKECSMDEHQDTDQARHLSAEQARGGDIVLQTAARRWIFVGGLIAVIVIAGLLA